jgi:hypothetical protein
VPWRRWYEVLGASKPPHDCPKRRYVKETLVNLKQVNVSKYMRKPKAMSPNKESATLRGDKAEQGQPWLRTATSFHFCVHGPWVLLPFPAVELNTVLDIAGGVERRFRTVRLSTSHGLGRVGI